MTTEQAIRKKRNVVLGCLFVFFATTTTLSLGGLFLITSPHIWSRWNAADILIDGQPASNSMVYRAKNGDLMIYLRQAESDTPRIYIIEVQRRRIGTPPGNDGQLFPFLGYLYARQSPPAIIPLDGTEAKTDQFDARLTFKPYRAEFTSLEKERVQVRW